jgi:hypothetical protein
MKNKNQRDLQNYWTKEAAKKAKPAKKKTLSREDRNHAAIRKAQQAGGSPEEA